MPSDAEWAEMARAVLRDDAAGKRAWLSDGARARIHRLLARVQADDLALSLPCTADDVSAPHAPHETRKMMMVRPADSRRPDGERIAALETEMDTIKKDLASASDKLDQVLENLNRANGGVKVLTWLGGLLIGGGALSFLGNAFGVFHAAQGK